MAEDDAGRSRAQLDPVDLGAVGGGQLHRRLTRPDARVGVAPLRGTGRTRRERYEAGAHARRGSHSCNSSSVAFAHFTAARARAMP